MNEQNGFFDGNPKMIFVFGLVAGIALTMVLGNTLPTFGGTDTFSDNLQLEGVGGGNDDGAVDNNDIEIIDSDEDAKELVLSPVTDEDHILGDIDTASVVVIEYSDFECPFCSRFHPTMKELVDEYGDDIVWVYRHFPLSFHPEAKSAALASECANEQGKFWEYADGLFDNQEDLGDDLFVELASQLDLNIDQFTDCVDKDEYKSKVSSDYSSGVAAGVSGTPATFVNGEKVSGAVPYETLKELVDSYLDK